MPSSTSAFRSSSTSEMQVRLRLCACACAKRSSSLRASRASAISVARRDSSKTALRAAGSFALISCRFRSAVGWPCRCASRRFWEAPTEHVSQLLWLSNRRYIYTQCAVDDHRTRTPHLAHTSNTPILARSLQPLDTYYDMHNTGAQCTVSNPQKRTTTGTRQARTTHCLTLGPLQVMMQAANILTPHCCYRSLTGFRDTSLPTRLANHAGN